MENAYESVREMADAILFLEGYKSYSHEASLAYLKILGLPESVVESISNTKQRRNDIKYSGGDASKEEASNAIKVAEEAILILEKKLKLRLES